MASVKWIPPSASTIAHFERVAPGAPLETRSMFGMPCRFLNGHMLVGVFQDSIMLRLSEEDCALCIAAGASPFRPMGRDMTGYVALSAGTFDDQTLKQWIARGLRFLGSLAPKLAQLSERVPKKRTTKTAAPAAKRSRPPTGAKAARKPAAAKRSTKGRRGSGSKRRSPVRTPQRRTARREHRRLEIAAP
jgi:TfoX/Sxy family transcriptional regulator of competence genes